MQCFGEDWLCSTQKHREFQEKVHPNVNDNDIFKMSTNWLYKTLWSEFFKCMTGVFSPTFPQQKEEVQKRKQELIITATEIRR